MKGSSAFIILLLLISGCGKEELGPDEYKARLLTEEGWTRSKEIDGYTFRADYIPAAWIAYVNTGNKEDRKQYEAEVKEADGMYYFRLTINTNGNKNLLKTGLQEDEEYFERLYYVSYQMKNDVKLSAGDKSYPCRLYNYERAYDLSTKLSFMLGFAKDAVDEDIVLEVDPAILGTGRIKMKFKRSDIQSVPKLIIDDKD